jgi:hypothetical protein
MPSEMIKSDKPLHDFTPQDLEKIEKFKEEGMLGLAAINETDVTIMMDHYLSGRNYREIAKIMNKDKTLIMFLSQKLDWFALRREYIEELMIHNRDRVLEHKLSSQDFLLKLTYALEKKISRHVTRFLKTNSEEDAKKIDDKAIDKYLKVVEALHRLNGETKLPGEKPPLVGITPTGGMTITKTADNKIEITTRNENRNSRLKKFADMKRAEEKPKSNDIEVESTPDGDESDDENEE